MKKKKLSPLWLIPAVVIVALILWCIYFPLTMFMGLDKEAEPLSATVIVSDATTAPEIEFTTNDTDELANIVENLCHVRCRFFGWSNMMRISAEKPTLDLMITGNAGENPFNIRLSVNGYNEVHIWGNNVCLRAKNTALYDYLTELALSGKE